MTNVRILASKKRDPIFACIADDKRAQANYSAALTIEDAASLAGKKSGDLKRAADAADRVCARTTRKLCRTRPTSLEGLEALISYATNRRGGVGIDCHEFTDGRSDDFFETVLASIRDLKRMPAVSDRRVA